MLSLEMMINYAYRGTRIQFVSRHNNSAVVTRDRAGRLQWEGEASPRPSGYNRSMQEPSSVSRKRPQSTGNAGDKSPTAVTRCMTI